MSLWGKRRQLTYFTILALAIIAVLVIGFFILRPSSSCFDNKQNGDETGVDCGGTCARVCLVGVLPLRTSWIRVFPISAQASYVIALIENPNNGIGIERLPYTIRLVDEEGLLVTTRRGDTFVNAREKLVIFEGSIETGARKPVRASITFENDFEWQKSAAAKPALLVEKRSFQNDTRPRLEVSVTNDSIYTLENITLPVILSDKNGNAFAGSSTVIDRLAKNETKNIIFTWPAAFPELPAAIDVYPHVNQFDLP